MWNIFSFSLLGRLLRCGTMLVPAEPSFQRLFLWPGPHSIECSSRCLQHFNHLPHIRIRLHRDVLAQLGMKNWEHGGDVQDPNELAKVSFLLENKIWAPYVIAALLRPNSFFSAVIKLVIWIGKLVREGRDCLVWYIWHPKLPIFNINKENTEFWNRINTMFVRKIIWHQANHDSCLRMEKTGSEVHPANRVPCLNIQTEHYYNCLDHMLEQPSQSTDLNPVENLQQPYVKRGMITLASHCNWKRFLRI